MKAKPPVRAAPPRAAALPTTTAHVDGVRCRSFAPVIAPGCRLMILGSMPGLQSLRAEQYYYHPQNLFWRFMGELFGAGRELPYEARLERLKARHVGLWDSLAHCERGGSLDSAIVRDSEVPNDFAALLAAHPSVRAIACNGGKSWQAFRRHVVPTLRPDTLARIECLQLPSTSPANASQPVAAKLERWRVLQRYATPI